MYHFEIQNTTTLLTQPEGSNSISKFWKSLKMGKGQRAYRPHKLCYAMLYQSNHDAFGMFFKILITKRKLK